MNVDYKLIGKRIKEQRSICGFTQEVLAEKMDVTIGYISQIERGVTKTSLDFLGGVADALRCDVSHLVSGCSIGSDEYLDDEISKEFKRLSGRDRKIVLNIIKMLNEN